MTSNRLNKNVDWWKISSASLQNSWQNFIRSVLSGFFSHASVIASVSWYYAHRPPLTHMRTSSRPALWSGDDVWIWGIQWLMFSADGHWHYQTHEAPGWGRGPTAGLDKKRHQERQHLGFSGKGNTWTIQGHYQDAFYCCCLLLYEKGHYMVEKLHILY